MVEVAEVLVFKTDTFWERSLFVKPADRDDLGSDSKTLTLVNGRRMRKAILELGHIFYYQALSIFQVQMMVFMKP